MTSKQTVKKKDSLIFKAMLEEETGKKSFFYVTQKDCDEWFDIINREIFSDTLPEFRSIEILKRKRRVWAHCISVLTSEGERYCNLSIQERLTSKKQFIQIMAHEMVHVWEFINFGTSSHGALFHSWKSKFKRLNMVLTAGGKT